MSVHSTKRETKTSLLGESSFIKYDSLKTSVSEPEVTDTTTTVRRKNKDNHTVLELKPVPGNKSSEQSSYDENTVLLCEDIKEGDTLQSISLRYGCTVNELKRCNGLITEQDFYARTKIKIPVNRYSLLTVPDEKMRQQEEHDNFFSVGSVRNFTPASTNGHVSKTVMTTASSSIRADLRDDGHTRSSDCGSSESLEDSPLLAAPSQRNLSPSLDANKYLKMLDKDIRKTVKKADLKSDPSHSNESLNEVLSSIQYYPVNPIPTDVKRRKESNGADCGMSWWSVILCFFIVLGIVIALAIFEWYHSD